MISGISQSRFKEAEIERLVEDVFERKTLFAKPLEYVAGKGALWMPYHRIRMEYRRSREETRGKTGEKALAETALNAMFCGCVNNESELLMIFRPNYLKHEAVPIAPAAGELVGQASGVDFDAVLSGLVKKLNGVQDELSGLRSTLSKDYVRKRRYQMLLPMGNLKEEKDLSAKIAKLDALKNTINMCLNIDEEVGGIKVLSDDIFYYPTSVFLLKNPESKTRRFFIVNLVKTGAIVPRASCDILLTQLCNRNDKCGKLITAAVAGSSLPS